MPRFQSPPALPHPASPRPLRGCPAVAVGVSVRQKFNEPPAARMRGRDLEAGAGRVLAGVGGLAALLGTALFHWLVHRAPYPDDD